MAKYAETGFTKSYCGNGSEASSEKQKIFKRLKQNGSKSMAGMWMRSINLSVKLQVDAKRLLLIRAGFHRSIQESGYEHEQVRNTARTRNPRTDLC